MPGRATRLTVATAVAVLALTGCSSGESGRSGQSEGGATPQGAASASPSTTAAPENQDRTSAAYGIDEQAPPAAIATVEAPIPAGASTKPGATVTVELVQLRHRGEILYGLFRVTPRSGLERLTLHDALGGAFVPDLVDPVGLKRYTAITELTTGYTAQVNEGRPNYVNTAWPYPKGVATVDVNLGRLPTMPDVTVPQ